MGAARTDIPGARAGLNRMPAARPMPGGAGQQRPDTVVPWSTTALWRDIQAAFRGSLDRGTACMAEAREHAATIAHERDRLADLFDQTAAATCAGCPDPCCRHAKVWLDFNDLLFIHLNGEMLPARQLRRDLRDPCRYLGPRGCTLPQRSRPWICLWYVCPVLRQDLARGVPGGLVQAVAVQNRVKALRGAMEASFITALGMVLSHPR